MKKLATLLLALVLSLPLAVKAQSIKPASGFNGKVMDATFALFGQLKDQTQFLCTAWNYKVIPGGYDIVAAGHCVANNPLGVTYSVAEEMNGKQMPITLIKYELDKDGDFSLFEFKTDKNYPTLDLGTVDSESIGNKIINPNFADGIAKQLSFGTISTSVNAWEPQQGTTPVFWVQVFGAGGSSGSPVISDKTHKVIGILIYGDRDEETGAELVVGHGVEPIDQFYKFLDKPGQIQPISQEEFKEKFGPEHTFMLMVQGPNPKFDFGSHTFQCEIMGFSLSDEYYYDVPVYIDQDGRGGYRLMSTKEEIGVDLKLLS